MSAETFYADVPVLEDFVQVADPGPPHADARRWLVTVGDVGNSTGAIEKEQYRDVNVVGGSLIAATLKVAGPYSVPYMFAGDGARLRAGRAQEGGKSHC